MAVGVANHGFPIRKTNNARGGDIIDGYRAIRAVPAGPAF